TGTSLTPSVNVTNTPFDYVVDAVAFNNNVTLTPGAGQTNSFDLVHTTPNDSGGGSVKIGTTNTTMSWTATGANQAWAEIAVPVLTATPTVLFDAAASSRFTGTTATFTGSWNHTTTTAANRYLVVGVDIDLGGATANSSGVVYGTEAGGPNQAMTLLGSLSNG